MYIYSIPQLRDYVNRTVTNYYFIADDTNLDYFVPATDDNGFIVPVLMITEYGGELNTTKTLLTPTNLGLFSQPDEVIKESLSMTNKFTLSFNFYERLSLAAQTDGDCYYIQNVQWFEFSHKSVFTSKILTIRNTCITTFSPQDRQLWLLILIEVVALAQAILITRYIVNAFRRLRALQTRFQKRT